ncbi:unnamed protein product, partial [Rotaria magnacalcarata]
FMEVVRKLLPQELPFDMYVPNVNYLEGGCKNLIGNLYLSNFRLVFVPDNSTDDNLLDFRNITFTKCSVTKAYTIDSKNQQVSLTKMEKYIEALKAYSRIQQREQLYLYAAIQQYPAKKFMSKDNRSYTSSKLANRNFSENEISDLYLGKDEHIRSYMTYDDWRDELYEANEQKWIVDRRKFDEQATIQAEGPYVRFIYSNNYDSSGNLIWHWTHTSQVGNNGYYKRQMPAQKYMLITLPGVGEVTSSVEPNSTISLPATVSLSSPSRFNKIKKNLLKPLRRNSIGTAKLISTNESKTTPSDLTDMSQMSPDSGLRRVTTDTNLIGFSDMICDQPFQRYNLSKFPCNLKRLQSSYEKLIEICITTPEHKQARIEATVIYPSSQSLRHPNRSVYYVETSKSKNHSIDIPITNGSLMLNAEIYDYDTIESPQVFPSDLYVDWRTFNLVLWSKCYCRYDQTYLPTIVEQQLLFDINCLKEDLENMHTKSAQIILDTFENVGHANSWHPQTLVTRV